MAVTAALTIAGLAGTIAGWTFNWHSQQRILLENRLKANLDKVEEQLSTALSDAVWTLNNRDDRQDLRRFQDVGQLDKRLDGVGQAITRIEDVLLQIVPKRVDSLEDELRKVREQLIQKELQEGVRQGVVQGIEGAGVAE